jgi:hypothetical protein
MMHPRDMSEIQKSLTFLQEGIPQWLQDITRVEDKVAAMQEDMVRVSSSMLPFHKRSIGSNESIRHERADAVAEEATPSPGAQTDPICNRKRKTLSVFSGHASGPARLRRTMVITNYDGDMQKSLELLVRAIGTGRNLLRKAKMEAKMDEMAALAESSEEEDEADDDDDEDEGIVARSSYRPRMASMRARAAARRTGAQGGGAPVTLFDTTDKTLEHAQSLCEKAAHLTLRDGDCRKELEGIRQDFVDVLQTATTEAAKCRARPPPQLMTHDTSDTSVSSVEQPSYKRHLPEISPPSPEPQSEPKIAAATIHTASQNMVIEVDEDDDHDEEEEFVMPAVRLTSRYRVRA